MGDRDLIGRCGIYCDACAVYRGQRDDGEAFDYAIRRWKVPSEHARCNGCQALTPECHGSQCERAKCLNEKGYRYCFECDSYRNHSYRKYERMASYFKPMGEDPRRNLKRIEDGEADAWLKEHRNRWSCTSCGSPIFLHPTKCPKCGKLI